MESNIITIQGIDCYEQDGIAYLNLEACARGLGFTTTQTIGGKEYVNVRWATVRQYLTDIGFLQEVAKDDFPNKLGNDGLPDFIPENIFYRLAMKAKNEAAERFQALIADEIIPQIRRAGFYSLAQSQPPTMLTALQQTVQVLQAFDGRLRFLENAQQEYNAAMEAFVQPPDDTDWKAEIHRKVALITKTCQFPHAEVYATLYKCLEQEAHCNLKTLKKHRIERMEAFGAKKAQIAAVSKLDCISADTRLRSIFDTIVRKALIRCRGACDQASAV